jgi:ZIP family zinc transporter
LISLSFLAGMFIFFVIELFFHFHHCKDLGKEDCVHKHFSNKLMMLGTFIHNFLHGIVIYTGFLTNYVFGWLLTISIFLHSIPQNIANYLMNHKDLKGVLVAALGGIIGAAVLYPIREFIIQNKVYILACIAGMLLYLIISDILPEFKKRLHLKTQIIYLLIWILGFGFYILLEYLSKVFM